MGDDDLVAVWIDTPWWLDYGKVKARGYAGVVRYICSDYNTGPGSALPQKRITYAEAQQILANGLDYAVNFEDAAQDYLGGYARGYAKGQIAGGWMLNTLKAPAGMSCCSSLDADIGTVWKSPAKDYQHGFADGLTSEGPFVPGIYGSAIALNGAWADNTGHVFWLTAATYWSHGAKPVVQHLWQSRFWPYGSNADLDYTDTQPMGSYLQASGGDHMPLTQADVDLIWAHPLASQIDPAKTYSAGFILTSTNKDANDAEKAAKAVPTAAAIATEIIAQLPPAQAGGITQAQVEDACRAALTDAKITPAA
jgi:hypothetical protein